MRAGGVAKGEDCRLDVLSGLSRYRRHDTRASTTGGRWASGPTEQECERQDQLFITGHDRSVKRARDGSRRSGLTLLLEESTIGALSSTCRHIVSALLLAAAVTGTSA